MKSFTTAISMLTVIPVPQSWSNNITTSSIYFGLVGILVGCAYMILEFALDLMKVSAEWQALLMIFAMVLITRGFHLDGLADMADGFWGGADREKILKIMKDSATGVFGALALILVILVKWLSIKNLVESNYTWVLLSSAVISRFSMTFLSGLFDYARNEGTGNLVIKSTSPRHIYIAFIYIATFLVIFRGYGLFLVIFSGSVFSLLTGYISRNKIGGITGDILGASSELTESFLLAITPVLVSLLPPPMWRSPLF